MGKRPQPQQPLYEDCGSALSPLMRGEAGKSVLACSFNVFDDVLEYCFGEGLARDEKSATRLAQLVDDDFHFPVFPGTGKRARGTLVA